jgi:hypothetical protein
MRAAHPDDERLILFHYEGDRSVARHLDACLPCRGRMAGIRRLFELVEAEPVPERGEAYGRDVWRRIAARLPERPPRPGWRLAFAPPRLAFAGALAAIALAAFLAGRFWRSPDSPAAATVSQTRERILLVTVGDHLERSQAVLIELLHAPAEGPAAERDRARARELLAANRLYRQTAASAGERGVSDVLEDLERVLLEASHGASPVSFENLDGLRRKAEAEGVLFKIRVLGSRVREREEAMAPRNERKRT